MRLGEDIVFFSGDLYQILRLGKLRTVGLAS